LTTTPKPPTDNILLGVCIIIAGMLAVPGPRAPQRRAL